MRRQRIMPVAVALSLLFSVADLAQGGKVYSKRQRTNTSCGIPTGYSYGHDTSRFGGTAFAVTNTPTGTGALYHRPFHFRASALIVDHIQLDQVGLAIYQSSGALVATGRITHDGGDGGLIGNNVTIRVRAYVAAQADPVRVPPDARVVWQSEQHLWVSRDRPRHISLAPSPHSGGLAAHFDEITHLEVELEYQRDR